MYGPGPVWEAEDATEYETNLAPTSERFHFNRKQTSQLQYNLLSAMKREEQGPTGGNRRTQTAYREGRKIFPEATGATSVVFVRQDVDRWIKLPWTVHSLLSRDPEAETYLHNPGPPPGRMMSLVLCWAET